MSDKSAKKAVVAELKEQLESSKAVVLTTYKGLTVEQDTELRSELRKAGVTYHVVKNTMLRIAAKEAGIEGLDEQLNGTTAMAYSTEDAVAPAKGISEFIKKNKLDEAEVLQIKAGMLDGKVIALEKVKELASLPSREELLAKLLGSMNAPIANTANVLQGVIRKAVYALNAVREQKEQASA
jgi:large subunit ribosomal protein L10